MQAILYLIRQFSKIIKWLDKKGSGHFTIMFIPYSERKILSFQISNYTVSFIILLFSFAIFNLYHYSITKKELVDNLKDIRQKEKLYWDSHKFISKNVEQTEKEAKEIRNELDEIYKIIAIKDYLDWDDITSKALEIKNRYDTEHDLPKNIYKIEEVKQTLSEANFRFQEIKKLLENRNKLIDHLPTRWPIFGDKGYKTSGYGKRFSPFEGKYKFHAGIDIAAFPRTPIVATADGIIIFAGIKGSYGNTVIISHKYGYKSLYGHNARLLVKVNQKVRKGQKIALLGRTGRVTGYHVHFEIRIGNVPVDPWMFITAEI